MKRETAWRVFAGEYNDSTVEIKGDGEKKPSYIVTPLGAKVNRVFIIGVLTDVENISEGGDMVRAHVSDPTGVFTLYSGQYQKDVTDILSSIEVPAFVAVIGKVRTYSPEEGVLYVSIRPERVAEVNADIRDKWILETCKSTKERIEAVFEAMKMDKPDVYALKKLGYSKELSEGVIAALKNYGRSIDLNKYVTLLQESLEYLVPGGETKTLPIPKTDEKQEKVEEKHEKEPLLESIESETIEEETREEPRLEAAEEVKKEEEEDEGDSIEVENSVLETIKDLEGKDETGAQWDTIVEECKKKGFDKDTVEEAIASLMNKGFIYEPTLGVIKTT